jgi:hypothetical protein
MEERAKNVDREALPDDLCVNINRYKGVTKQTVHRRNCRHARNFDIRSDVELDALLERGLGCKVCKPGLQTPIRVPEEELDRLS